MDRKKQTDLWLNFEGRGSHALRFQPRRIRLVFHDPFGVAIDRHLLFSEGFA